MLESVGSWEEMDITFWIEAFGLWAIAIFFGFALRLIFAMHPEGSNSDQWGVLGQIKKHVGLRWIDYSMPDAIPTGIFGYPMLLHFFISRFSKKRWKALNVFINQGSDLVVATIVFALILHAVPAKTPSDALDLAWLGMLLFLSLPILMPITARLKAHNGRCFGMLLNTLYLLCMYAVITDGSLLGAACCIVLLLAIFLTSLFAMQTAIYFSVGLAVWYFHWAPLAIIGIAAGISFLFPSLGARDTLVFKVNHFIWYWDNYNKNTTAAGRNLFRNFFLFFKHFPKDRVESLTIFYRSSPLWVALYSVPCFWILIPVLAVSANARLPMTNGLGAFSFVLILLTFAAFILTSVGRLVIFGTAERYFEYAAPFLIVSFALAIHAAGFDIHAVFVPLIIFQIGTVLFNDTTYRKRFFRWLREPETEMSKPAQEALAYLAALPEDARVATVPIKLTTLLTAHNPDYKKIKFYYRLIQQNMKLDGFKYFADDTVDLNVFGGTPEDLVRKYGITHVLCRKSYLKPGNFDFINAIIERERLFENDQFVIFSATNPGGEPADHAD